MDELQRMDADFQENTQPRAGTNLPAEFSLEAVYDEAKSKAQGRAVYTDREIIEIHVGRDLLRKEVTDEHRRQYAAKYAAWKKGDDQEAIDGFPLAQWAALPGKALVKEFAFFGIRSVEQLAAATDSTIQRVGPHMSLRQKARDWVADAEKRAPLVKLREENDALKARLSALEGMFAKQSKEMESARANGGTVPAPTEDPRIAAMQEQLASLAAAMAPKPRGRPKKTTNGVA